MYLILNEDCLSFCRHLQNPAPGGLMPRAQNVESEKDAFHLFLTKDLITKTKNNTNKRILHEIQALNPAERDKLKKKPFIKITTEQEIEAYIGLVYYRGLLQWNYMAVRDFWNLHPIFGATMSIQRFYFLNNFITFDDFEDRDTRWRSDRGAAIREVLEEWNDNLSNVIFIDGVGQKLYSKIVSRQKFLWESYSTYRELSWGTI